MELDPIAPCIIFILEQLIYCFHFFSRPSSFPCPRLVLFGVYYTLRPCPSPIHAFKYKVFLNP